MTNNHKKKSHKNIQTTAFETLTHRNYYYRIIWNLCDFFFVGIVQFFNKMCSDLIKLLIKFYFGIKWWWLKRNNTFQIMDWFWSILHLVEEDKLEINSSDLFYNSFFFKLWFHSFDVVKKPIGFVAFYCIDTLCVCVFNNFIEFHLPAQMMMVKFNFKKVQSYKTSKNRNDEQCHMM